MEPSRYHLRSRASRPLGGLNPVSHGSTLPGRPISASGTRSSRFFDSIPASAALPSAGNAIGGSPAAAVDVPAQSFAGLSERASFGHARFLGALAEAIAPRDKASSPRPDDSIVRVYRGG